MADRKMRNKPSRIGTMGTILGLMLFGSCSDNRTRIRSGQSTDPTSTVGGETVTLTQQKAEFLQEARHEIENAEIKLRQHLEKGNAFNTEAYLDSEQAAAESVKDFLQYRGNPVGARSRYDPDQKLITPTDDLAVTASSLPGLANNLEDFGYPSSAASLYFAAERISYVLDDRDAQAGDEKRLEQINGKLPPALQVKDF